jgi:glycogen debranching enzyme
METLANKFDDKNYAEKMKKMAQDHQISFEEKFYNHKKKSLYDVLGDDKIRPNQLFAIATTYPVIKPSSEIGKAILKIFNCYHMLLILDLICQGSSQKEEGTIHSSC